MSTENRRSAYVKPSYLQGKVYPPLSKSLAHRRLFCLYLAALDGAAEALNAFEEAISDVRTRPEEASDDILASCAVLEAMLAGQTELDCNESGSTLRFAIPVVGLSATKKIFTGKGRLPLRPLAEYQTALQGHGMELSYANAEEGLFLPLSVSGELHGGEFSLPGHISSQYLTGLLLALPCVEEDSLITLETALESVPYVKLTIAEQRLFGVEIEYRETIGPFGSYAIKGGQRYKLPEYLPPVEADTSQAAFFHLANFLGADIDVQGLSTSTKQGDAVFRYLLGDLCLMQKRPNPSYIVQECDVSQFPDIVPALALASAIIPGTHILRNAGRLRLKECDRLMATAEMLQELGVEVEEGIDFILVKGLKKPLGGYVNMPDGERLPLWFKQGKVKTYHDHRMMMCLCIAAAHTVGGLLIDDIDCVKKSYPHFLDDFSKLGGIVEVQGDW